MNLHEELFIKISTDFHNEINPILKEIDPEIVSHYWYYHRNIYGKLKIIKALILSLTGFEISRSILTRLIGILRFYNSKMIRYFQNEKLATGFVFFAPDNVAKINLYYTELAEFIFRATWGSSGSRYYLFIPIDIVPFPNDCSYKLSAKILNGEIVIQHLDYPVHEVDTKKGTLNDHTSRSRMEQLQIEQDIFGGKYDKINTIKKMTLKSFKEFCEETHLINTQLLDDFSQAIEDANLFYSRELTESYSVEILKIKPYYDVLYEGRYIIVEFDEFKGIFKQDPPMEKIIWLKSGPRLKFLIDQLNKKYKFTSSPNKWGAERFKMPKITSNFVKYLSKQGSQTEYLSHNNHNHPKDELWKIINN